jgi:hypothetical protein
MGQQLARAGGSIQDLDHKTRENFALVQTDTRLIASTSLITVERLAEVLEKQSVQMAQSSKMVLSSVTVIAWGIFFR